MHTTDKRAIFVVLLTNALSARATTPAEFTAAHEGASALGVLAFPVRDETVDPLTPVGGGTEGGEVTLTLHEGGALASEVETTHPEATHPQADGDAGESDEDRARRLGAEADARNRAESGAAPAPDAAGAAADEANRREFGGS